MKIRTKLLLGATTVALLPIVLTAGFIGHNAYTTARDSLATEVESKLVSVRDNKKAQIEGYLDTLLAEVEGVARTQVAVEALAGFEQAHRAIVAESGGDSQVAAFREELRRYYTQDFAQEFTRRNAKAVPDTGAIADKLDPVAVTMQYHYIAANPNPLGKKDQLFTSPDTSDYSRLHARFHSSFEALQKKLGYYDVFLIDNDGRVTTVNKYVTSSTFDSWTMSFCISTRQSAARARSSVSSAIVDLRTGEQRPTHPPRQN